ncbi:unnamed protein product [Ilex paraguariensis]|uniref:Phytocyanin domain-containing protein n=1 Tax=Ilex paraguariensis TaxID=185542 RepID=A0ABC8RRE1_9AQUA
MEQRHSTCSFGLVFFIFSTLCLLLSFSGSVGAYKNYTVGDSLGWFDNLEKPSVNYQKWVAGKNFSLGDFLFFNSDNNHSVIQTYNFNTYKRCDYQNALNNDTTQWSSADPSATSPQPISVAVPLLKVGMTYFFSGDYDGDQCKNGQHFKINVTYGQGLPQSLKNPSNDAPSPANPVSGDDESAPDTLVPSNFSDPQGTSDDIEASQSVSLSVLLKLYGRQLHGVLIILGLICTF